MLVLIKITFASCVVWCIWAFVYSWKHGSDYKIEGNYGRRLNPIEKWIDGFDKFMKL